MNRFNYGLASAVSLLAFRVFFRLRRFGVSNLPKTGPVMIVGNHTSFFDPPLVGCSLPRRTHYFARSTLGKNRLIAAYLKSLGTLFVDRDGQARAGLDLGIDTLSKGGLLTLFPEGTRSKDGRVGPFKRGLLLMLKKAPAQVLPVGIRGCHRAFPRGGKLPRLFSPISLHFGEPMMPEEVLAPGGLEELRRRVALLSGEDPNGEDSLNPAADGLGADGSGADQTVAERSKGHAGESQAVADTHHSSLDTLDRLSAAQLKLQPALGWSGRAAVVPKAL